MSDKVLLLQGPLDSIGINFFTADKYKTPEERKLVWSKYDCRENVKVLVHLFCDLGFKTVYSGWEEDAEWLNANSHLFDAMHIASQSELTDTVEFQGRLIQNNKEKLYFSCYAGCLAAAKITTREAPIIRLRSDVFLNHRAMAANLAVLDQLPHAFLIEYANLKNTYFVPDFVTAGSLSSHMSLYDNLLNACQKNGGHHISSHIDHGIELAKLSQEGTISNVICMQEEIHKTMVWRGIPQYATMASKPETENIVFNCALNYPRNHDFAQVIDAMPPEVAGKRGEIEKLLH